MRSISIPPTTRRWLQRLSLKRDGNRLPSRLKSCHAPSAVTAPPGNAIIGFFSSGTRKEIHPRGRSAAPPASTMATRVSFRRASSTSATRKTRASPSCVLIRMERRLGGCSVRTGSRSRSCSHSFSRGSTSKCCGPRLTALARRFCGQQEQRLFCLQVNGAVIRPTFRIEVAALQPVLAASGDTRTNPFSNRRQ